MNFSKEQLRTADCTTLGKAQYFLLILLMRVFLNMDKPVPTKPIAWLLLSLMAGGSMVLPFSSSTAGTACIFDGHRGYRLTDLERLQTSVIVRSGPSTSRQPVYELDLTANGIRCVGPCRDGWCRIRWHGVVGWIPRRNMTDDVPAASNPSH